MIAYLVSRPTDCWTTTTHTDTVKRTANYIARLYNIPEVTVGVVYRTKNTDEGDLLYVFVQWSTEEAPVGIG